MIPGKISHKRLSKCVFSRGLSPRGAPRQRLSSWAVTAPPLAPICPPQSWFDVMNSWLTHHILHGPCSTLPGLFGLHLLLNTTSQLACLWCDFVRERERRRELASVSPFVRDERNWVSLWVFGSAGDPKLPQLSLLKHHLASGTPVSPYSPRLHSPLALDPCLFLPTCPLYALSTFPLPGNTNLASKVARAVSLELLDIRFT